MKTHPVPDSDTSEIGATPLDRGEFVARGGRLRLPRIKATGGGRLLAMIFVIVVRSGS